jgi:hypothetical protein
MANAKVFVTFSVLNSRRNETEFFILSDDHHDDFALLPTSAMLKVRFNQQDRVYDVSIGQSRLVQDATFFHTRNKKAVRPFFEGTGPRRYTSYSHAISTRRSSSNGAKWDFYNEALSHDKTELLMTTRTPKTWSHLKRMIVQAWRHRQTKLEYNDTESEMEP